MNFSDLENITSGTILAQPQDRPVISLFVDSRKVPPSEGALFFAIKGQRHNGHRFILELYHGGIRQFVVESKINPKDFPEANFILVSNTIDALQHIASYHRDQFDIPIIGITGSNGKTIIKEWLYQLTTPDFIVVKNPGSYNSQVGVPLSIWNIQYQHTLGIFEAGISTVEEMNRLNTIIKPTLGVFSNIGTAHDEGFPDRQTKIREKIKLFNGVEALIFCHDEKEIAEEIRHTKLSTFSWGFQKGDILITETHPQHYSIQAPGINAFSISIPFNDPASIENCFHCLAVMLYLRFDLKIIQQKINKLQHIPMRLELKEGINQCHLIDDSYNNDLEGLRISLDFLTHQKQKNKKRVILSDILESGLSGEILAHHIFELINLSEIDAFVGIGQNLHAHAALCTIPASFYLTTNDYINSAEHETYANESILIKGARTFMFEKITQRLQHKTHGTILEIDLNAISYNLNLFKSKLSDKTKMMVMVKAFAYGSGDVEVANILQYHRVDYLGVAYTDEGVHLRKNHITIPIMIMNPSGENFDHLVEFDLEPEIYSIRILKEFVNFLEGRPAKIHIKLDTGMHRLGLEKKHLTELCTILAEHQNLVVASVFSHLAGADHPDHDIFSSQQVSTFEAMYQILSDAIGYKPLRHILNSPGIIRHSEWELDMVRLGVGLYGINPTKDDMPLKTVATLKTVISQIKHIDKGETVGYGRRGRAKKSLTVATLAIGYADGFSRAFSNGIGAVQVHGQEAPVLGSVCMDMTMVDITGIPAKEGDEVIIFGKDYSIYEVSHKINTIPYEILTNTSQRVKRVFVAESI